MRAQRKFWLCGALAGGLSLLGSLVAPAQQGESAGDAITDETEAAPELDVDGILREDADVFAGRGY